MYIALHIFICYEREFEHGNTNLPIFMFWNPPFFFFPFFFFFFFLMSFIYKIVD